MKNSNKVFRAHKKISRNISKLDYAQIQAEIHSRKMLK